MGEPRSLSCRPQDAATADARIWLRLPACGGASAGRRGPKNEGIDNKYGVGLDRRLAKCRRGGTRRHIRFALGCAQPACAWNSKACTRSGTEAIPPVLLGVSCRTGTFRECGRIPEFLAQPGTRSLSEARCCCGTRSFEKGLIHFSWEFR